MTPCLDDTVLFSIAQGHQRLDSKAEAHLAGCDDCRRIFASAVRHAPKREGSSVDVDSEREPTWEELGQGVLVAQRFELEAFLGSGAMGVVWAARDTHTHVRVAVKVARSVSRELSQRFERESAVMSAVDHPSIVASLQFVPATEGRGPCIVMPLLEGETFEARLLRMPRLSVAEVCTIVADVAGALATTHKRGIIHRDLKPQNVFLTPSRAVVLDFGIAKLMADFWEDAARLTRSGVVLGSVAYMAPEQLFGERDVDARADIWALGMMLLRALIGRSVLGESRAEALEAIQRRTWLTAAEVYSLPVPLRDLLGRMLVVEREKRLDDVLHALRVLREAAEGVSLRTPFRASDP
jgi:eukaryotic-like serine/threonine-protein kinase